MARRPQSREQKIAKGETRADRLAEVKVVEFPKVESVPDAPDWLANEDAVSLWNDLAPRLVHSGVMTVVDQHQLAHLCQLHGELVDCYRRRIKPSASDISRLESMFAAFGLNPASRTRVTKPTEERERNKFAGNGKKKA